MKNVIYIPEIERQVSGYRTVGPLEQYNFIMLAKAKQSIAKQLLFL